MPSRSASGGPPPELATLLPQFSKSATDTGTPPTCRLGIRQRARGRRDHAAEALRAEGYFDGTVGFRLERAEHRADQGVVDEVERLAKQPEVVLVFDVQPGPRYLFGRLDTDIVQDSRRFHGAGARQLGLVEGEPARTQLVLDAEQKLLTDARKAGFALAALQDARRHRRS